jgi:hypothetical protein
MKNINATNALIVTNKINTNTTNASIKISALVALKRRNRKAGNRVGINIKILLYGSIA